MSNVKPGDLAKFVGTPHSDGKVCYVLDKPSMWLPGQILCWEVELLEPSLVQDIAGWTRSGAGRHCVCADSCLRRIDPPADETSDDVVQERETAS